MATTERTSGPMTRDQIVLQLRDLVEYHNNRALEFEDAERLSRGGHQREQLTAWKNMHIDFAYACRDAVKELEK